MSSEQPTVPYGYCQCGCGRKTKLADRTYVARRMVRGEPLAYIHGHNQTLVGDAYRVDPTTGCWVWTRGLRAGYGRIRRDGKDHRAHRWMYERLVGPIPEGLVLDHLCRNKLCVNPDHLEPVTQQENVIRGYAAKRAFDAIADRAWPGGPR